MKRCNLSQLVLIGSNPDKGNQTKTIHFHGCPIMSEPLKLTRN